MPPRLSIRADKTATLGGNQMSHRMPTYMILCRASAANNSIWLSRLQHQHSLG